MVKIMENPIKNGWFGGTPIFRNIHIVAPIHEPWTAHLEGVPQPDRFADFLNP